MTVKVLVLSDIPAAASAPLQTITVFGTRVKPLTFYISNLTLPNQRPPPSFRSKAPSPISTISANTACSAGAATKSGSRHMNNRRTDIDSYATHPRFGPIVSVLSADGFTHCSDSEFYHKLGGALYLSAINGTVLMLVNGQKTVASQVEVPQNAVTKNLLFDSKQRNFRSNFQRFRGRSTRCISTLMQTSTSTPKIVRANDAPHLELNGEIHRLLLDGDVTGGVLSLLYSRLQSGGVAPMRADTKGDKWFWIERGHFDFQLDEADFSLQSGDFVWVPRGVAHSYRSTDEEGGALLIGALGAHSGQLFHALHNELENGGANEQKLAAQHGIRFDDFTELSEPNSAPFVLRSHEGECAEAFGDKSRLLIPSASVERQFCLFAGETPPLSGPPLHVHGRESEAFYILAGRYEFQFGNARVQAGAGDVAWAPRGVPHTFRVVSTEPGQCLTLCAPGGFDEFFAQCQQLFQSGAATPDAIIEIGSQHQIQFLPPAT